MSNTEQLMRDALAAIQKQGNTIEKLQARIAELEAQLEEAQSATKSRGNQTLGDAVEKALAPSARATATRRIDADTHFQAGRARQDVVTKRVEALSDSSGGHDLTARIRDRRAVRKAQGK